MDTPGTARGIVKPASPNLWTAPTEPYKQRSTASASPYERRPTTHELAQPRSRNSSPAFHLPGIAGFQPGDRGFSTGPTSPRTSALPLGGATTTTSVGDVSLRGEGRAECNFSLIVPFGVRESLAPPPGLACWWQYA